MRSFYRYGNTAGRSRANCNRPERRINNIMARELTILQKWWRHTYLHQMTSLLILPRDLDLLFPLWGGDVSCVALASQDSMQWSRLLVFDAVQPGRMEITNYEGYDYSHALLSSALLEFYCPRGPRAAPNFYYFYFLNWPVLRRSPLNPVCD